MSEQIFINPLIESKFSKEDLKELARQVSILRNKEITVLIVGEIVESELWVIVNNSSVITRFIHCPLDLSKEESSHSILESIDGYEKITIEELQSELTDSVDILCLSSILDPEFEFSSEFITSLVPKVKNGGILTGNQFKRKHQSVTKAVSEFAILNGISPRINQGRWSIVKDSNSKLISPIITTSNSQKIDLRLFTTSTFDLENTTEGGWNGFMYNYDYFITSLKLSSSSFETEFQGYYQITDQFGKNSQWIKFNEPVKFINGFYNFRAILTGPLSNEYVISYQVCADKFQIQTKKTVGKSTSYIKHDGYFASQKTLMNPINAIRVFLNAKS